MTVKNAAEKWNISVRRVQNLCKSGSVEGATRWGREWMIPEGLEKPFDRRKNGAPLTDNKTSLYELDLPLLFFTPGTADKILASKDCSAVYRDIFQIQIHLYRGEFEKGKQLALSCIKSEVTDLQGCHIGMCLAMLSVFSGDVRLWNRSCEYIKSIKIDNPAHRDVIAFWFAANESIIYNTTHFTPKFRRGNFNELPEELHSLARYYYVRYLFIAYHDEKDWNLNAQSAKNFMDFMPLLIEPLITQTQLENALITEIYLHLLCAFAYHYGNKDDLANMHVDKAIDLCLPDRMYLPLAEHRRQIGILIDERLLLKDKNVYAEVKRLSKTVHDNWVKIHNIAMDKSISAALTARERQICRFAVYGFANKEIAQRLSISENAVKQALRSSMNKTGVSTRRELQKFV